MRVIVIGGTRFLGRRIVERLHARGDAVMVVHRGTHTPQPWIPVTHLRCERRGLPRHAGAIVDFDPDAVVDTYAMTAADVADVLPALPHVRAVALSSQDVYEAHTGLLTGRASAPVPISEDAAVRSSRYPYQGAGLKAVPEDYEKLDVEERWRERDATILRLPLIYGPHDSQRREDLVLRRLRAGRRQIPVGAANLLWTRGHVDDLATGVLAALDTDDATGTIINLGEPRMMPIRWWLEQILAAAGSDAELVRVADHALPDDLAITAAPAQHLLVDVRRAETLLGWAPGDPSVQVRHSVRWHLDHPPEEATWSAQDEAADAAALAQRL